MHPGAFQLAGPVDVVFLIKPCLEFHQHHHLFAVFRRINQGMDDRGVARGAIQGHLDRQHIRIAGCFRDKPLHRGRKGVIGMVQQQVLTANFCEKVADFLFLWGLHIFRRFRQALHPLRNHWVPGRIFQVRQGQAQKGHEVPQPQQTGDGIDALGGNFQLFEQSIANFRGHGVQHL